MFPKRLLVSCFVFVALTGIRCHNSGTNDQSAGIAEKETAKQQPIILIYGAKDCQRECKDGESPKICYYYFNVERYPVLGKACEFCTPNHTNAIESNCQCIIANGYKRITSVVNRMLPGPSIQVCKGDKIIVDVENNLKGEEISIHWHGFHQIKTQYYDGTPLITQCPILCGTTFRYQFTAENVGTHQWYSLAPFQRQEGVHGSIVVRDTIHKEPNGALYDNDLSEHVLVLSLWLNTQATERFPGTSKHYSAKPPNTLLINGKGLNGTLQTGNITHFPWEELYVKEGCRYRFRLINAFGIGCQAELAIQGHTLTVIEVDGAPVRPVNVTKVISAPGERLSFVVNACQIPNAYWMRIRALGRCALEKIQQITVLRYEKTFDGPSSQPPTYDEEFDNGHISDQPTQLVSAHPVDKKIIQEPDIKLYFGLSYVKYTSEVLFAPGTYNPYLLLADKQNILATVNGISFAYPSSPPLSQFNNVTSFCNAQNLPHKCGLACRCTHTIKIPLGSCVELIIFDDERGSAKFLLPLHMHGHSFNVIGSGVGPNGTQWISKNLIDFDSKHGLHRNFHQPLIKDTIVVPNNGHVILRFCANNPGFWLFRSQNVYQEIIGAGLLLHVGELSDLPPVPHGFPVCGNYLPPIERIKY